MYFNVETRKEVKFFLHLILQGFLGIQYYAMTMIAINFLSVSKHKASFTGLLYKNRPDV